MGSQLKFHRKRDFAAFYAACHQPLMKKLPIVFLVILLAGTLATPFCRYGIVGLARGESFYKGRPTSYWRGVVKHFAGLLKSVPIGKTAVFPPPTTFLDNAHAFLGKILSKEIGVPPDESDFSSLPIYIELLSDEDADVREYAAVVIGKMGPSAKAAVPGLSALLKDKSIEVRIEAERSLMILNGITASHE